MCSVLKKLYIIIYESSIYCIHHIGTAAKPTGIAGTNTRKPVEWHAQKLREGSSDELSVFL
jgi:hypothetical protein